MIKLENVTVGYKENVLENINLDIKDNKITFIIGKNGSGKSTLGNIISGLNTKFKGNLVIDDKNINKKVDIKEMRHLVGAVFQNPDNQIIFTKVYDDIKFTLENMDTPKDSIDKNIKEALKTVDALELIDLNPYNFSGGEKARVAIASILALKPKYIVFDEATSMLDINGKESIYRLINNLKKLGIGVIMITNIMDELIYADEIIILDKKKAIKYSKEEIFKDMNILTKHGLNIPFNLKIIKALNKKGIRAYKEDDILKGIDSL